jgi:hypothetical protein
MGPKVYEFTSEAREHFGIFDGSIEVSGGGERLGKVEFDLSQAGFDVKSCIPSATISPVESIRFARLGVGEGSVDEVRVRDAVDQFMRSHLTCSTSLRNPSGARGTFDLAQRLQFGFIHEIEQY